MQRRTHLKGRVEKKMMAECESITVKASTPGGFWLESNDISKVIPKVWKAETLKGMPDKRGRTAVCGVIFLNVAVPSYHKGISHSSSTAHHHS